MRHRKKFNHLGRTSPHRKAMLANMATSLILHKGIITTVAKAKALKVYVEPIITKSKEDSTHNRRLVFSQLSDKKAVAELFREVAVKVAQRPGGYTRILRIGNRAGDNAELCRLELVDYNENMLSTKAAGKAKSTRTRRAGKKKEEGTVSKVKAQKAEKETPKAEVTVVDEPKAETPKVEETKVETPKAEAPESEAPKADEDNSEKASE